LQGNNKVYDALPAATLSFKGTPTAGGDDVTLVSGTAAFNDKNAGTGKPVSYSGYSVGGADAGKFQLFTLPGDIVGTGTTSADITPLALTGAITAADKVYDGTPSATILTRSLSTPIAGDDVSYSGGTALFADKTVANAKTVTASGLALSGADAGNYTVNTTAAASADITPLALTGAITAADKVYDGTPSATILTRSLSTPIAGDDVSYSGGTALFADKTVANAKTVTASGLALSGADAGNYTVNTTAAASADITPLAQRTATLSGSTLTDSFQGNATDTSPLIQNFASSVPSKLANLNLTVIGTGVAMPRVQTAQAQSVKPASPVSSGQGATNATTKTGKLSELPRKQDRY
jgi:hypothetical protein